MKEFPWICLTNGVVLWQKTSSWSRFTTTITNTFFANAICYHHRRRRLSFRSWPSLSRLWTWCWGKRVFFYTVFLWGFWYQCRVMQIVHDSSVCDRLPISGLTTLACTLWWFERQSKQFWRWVWSTFPARSCTEIALSRVCGRVITHTFSVTSTQTHTHHMYQSQVFTTDSMHDTSCGGEVCVLSLLTDQSEFPSRSS